MIYNTLELAKEFNLNHYTIRKIVEKYKISFKLFGNVKKKEIVYHKGTTGGRPSSYFILNEKHRFFLVMLLKNSDKNISIKIKELKKY